MTDIHIRTFGTGRKAVSLFFKHMAITNFEKWTKQKKK